MQGCVIQKATGAISGWTTVRVVKNLGWILRHWADVLRITVEPNTLDGSALVAFYLHDGRRYLTNYADRSVLRWFLDRPVFRGLIVTWNSRLYTIGDKQYRAMRERWESAMAPTNHKGERL